MSIQAKASGMTGPRGHIIALSRWRSRLAMIASLNTVFLTLFAIAGSLIMYVRKGIDPAELFHWFTINSNSLTAVGACMIVPFAVEGISKKYFSYPKWVAMLHYSGMVCTTLTMVFAAAFISWVDPELAFGGSNLYLHILCPCLVLVSFFLVESGHHLTKKDALIACIPTFLYELIYLWCVFIVGKENGGWEDMYFMNTYIPSATPPEPALMQLPAFMTVPMTEYTATAASPPTFSRIRLTQNTSTTEDAMLISDGMPPAAISRILRHFMFFGEKENTHFFDRKYPPAINTAT